jgi:hypothetical protein
MVGRLRKGKATYHCIHTRIHLISIRRMTRGWVFEDVVLDWGTHGNDEKDEGMGWMI